MWTIQLWWCKLFPLEASPLEWQIFLNILLCLKRCYHKGKYAQWSQLLETPSVGQWPNKTDINRVIFDAISLHTLSYIPEPAVEPSRGHRGSYVVVSTCARSWCSTFCKNYTFKSVSNPFPSCAAVFFVFFWLLVASLVRGTAMPLIQWPCYQYTGARFANLRRKTGWVNPLVLIQWLSIKCIKVLVSIYQM